MSSRIERLLGATSVRLALLQTSLFLVMFVCAGAAALMLIRHAEAGAVDAEIAEEVEDLRGVYTHAGLAPLTAMIEARQRDPSIWEFRVEDARHGRLAGDLPTTPFPAGWSTMRLVEGDKPHDAPEVVRSLTGALPDGLRLTVGEDVAARERVDNTVLTSIAGMAMLVAALGVGLGATAARRLLGRVDTMATAIDRFANGDRSARVQLPDHAPSDLDRLAAALNRMMERTTSLMQSMRQISSDIAHDLRRPLARHNQEIARVLQGPPSVDAYRDALEAASARVEEVLKTFQALLQIAELEAGAPGLDLQPVDLFDVAQRIVEAYAPMAEEGGRSLSLATPPGPAREAATAAQAIVLGEPRLLGRMLANLVENALVHTPPGTRVEVAVDTLGPRLTVADDGPGVPAPDRSRIFQRFVRLDASRSGPGAGLGLALASAVAAAFGGRLTAQSAEPGLRIVADFSRGG